jgi:aspartate/methionine/tyrosine aminotransferase
MPRVAGKDCGVNHVKPEQVLLGSGSTEILRMAAFAFLGSGKQLIQASPTFEAIEHYARSADSVANKNGLYPTTPGYDLATGIGTPKMGALITGFPEFWPTAIGT